MAHAFAGQGAGVQRHTRTVNAHQNHFVLTQRHQQGRVLYGQVSAVFPIGDVGDGKPTCDLMARCHQPVRSVFVSEQARLHVPTSARRCCSMSRRNALANAIAHRTSAGGQRKWSAALATVFTS
ncbi:MAG: hypothetical protein JW395_0324 [Nitrospira sp.]|nr:hypothetical protein [Nitrospira sp.]